MVWYLLPGELTQYSIIILLLYIPFSHVTMNFTKVSIGFVRTRKSTKCDQYLNFSEVDPRYYYSIVSMQGSH